jgi:beta-lactam-binding protein with PASTA domain
MELVNDSPRVLGNRYEVGDLLGRGGMAEVHLGRDARLGRTVAIKLLRTDLARDSTFQARFRREAQSAAALNHPAIVAVYDTGEEQVIESGGAVVNLPYIVMEHVEGRTLRDVLAEGHHLDVDAALDITTGVLTALEYSHRIGIVHRDIKPANVMLTPVGDVKVMDFGIARAMADASSTMTQTQAVIGTAQYLSPEQARGEQVDTRSDLYSAGCLLYELLTGRPPFVADSPVAVAYQHVREQPIPPSRLVPGIPDSVDRIVLHSLAKGRDERYQTAADFRADVEAARGGRQVYAAVPAMHGSNATTQYVPAADANGTQAMTAAAIGGSLLGADTMGGGSGVPGDPYDPYNQNGGRRQQRQQQKSNRNLILAGIGVVAVVALVGYLVMQMAGSGNGNNASAKVAMPSVLGQTEAAAKNALSEQQFTQVTSQSKASTIDQKGKVFEQDPLPNTQVAKSAPIVLWIGSGPATLQVPDVKGLTQDEARQKLTDAGLTPGNTETEDSTEVDAGQVTRTDPAKGEDVSPDQSITIYLASDTVTVPDLIDKTSSEAKGILDKLGLKYSVKSETSGDANPGTVIRTNPDPNQQVKRGSRVTLYVAKKPDVVPTTTPPSTGPTVTPSATPSTPGG